MPAKSNHQPRPTLHNLQVQVADIRTVNAQLEIENDKLRSELEKIQSINLELRRQRDDAYRKSNRLRDCISELEERDESDCAELARIVARLSRNERRQRAEADRLREALELETEKDRKKNEVPF